MVKKYLMWSALLLLLTPAAARADWLITPYVGGTFKGDASGREHFTYGLSAAFMGAGIIGGEVDLGYTPKFFEPKNSPDANNLIGSNNVTSLMGNLIIGVPVGGQTGAGFRPYVSGGLGLLKQNVPGVTDLLKVSNNDFGYNLGFGAAGFMSDHVGFRGDVRYLRSLQKDESTLTNFAIGNFDFWRWTVGVTFR